MAKEFDFETASDEEFAAWAEKNNTFDCGEVVAVTFEYEEV